MINKFKAGEAVTVRDEARNRTHPVLGAYVGKEVTIRKTSHGSTFVHLCGISNRSLGGAFMASRFEPVALKGAIKAGDIVVVSNTVANFNHDLLRYCIGTKFRVERTDGTMVLIEGLRNTAFCGKFGGDRFEKVREAAKPAPATENGEFVLMLRKDGKYLPSTEPRTYLSRSQAIKVGKVMAKRHGGKFVVFQAIASAEMPQTEPTVTEF